MFKPLPAACLNLLSPRELLLIEVLKDWGECNPRWNLDVKVIQDQGGPVVHAGKCLDAVAGMSVEVRRGANVGGFFLTRPRSDQEATYFAAWLHGRLNRVRNELVMGYGGGRDEPAVLPPLGT